MALAGIGWTYRQWTGWDRGNKEKSRSFHGTGTVWLLGKTKQNIGSIVSQHPRYDIFKTVGMSSSVMGKGSLKIAVGAVVFLPFSCGDILYLSAEMIQKWFILRFQSFMPA